jgi:hypothetical protein
MAKGPEYGRSCHGRCRDSPGGEVSSCRRRLRSGGFQGTARYAAPRQEEPGRALSKTPPRL